MKVKNLDKLISKLKKMKEIDMDQRIELTEELFEMQGEIEQAFHILNELPDGVEELNLIEGRKPIKKLKKRVKALEEKVGIEAPKEKKKAGRPKKEKK